jgi:Uma2 family endonuclease
VAIALRNRQADDDWRVLTGLRTKIRHSGAYVYPDVTVYEAPGDFGVRRRGDDETLLDPILIVEVFSSLTEALDRGTKWAHYRTIPSLREYVLLSENGVSVERYVRQDSGWLYGATQNPEGVLDLTSVRRQVPVREIYERAHLPAERTSMLIPPVDLLR